MDLSSLSGQGLLKPEFGGTICRFYEEGRCVKGSACPFMHPDGREGVRRGVNRLCYNCQCEGHLARDCPRNQPPPQLGPSSGMLPGVMPILPPLDSASLARLPSPMLGALGSDPAALFNAAAAAHAAAAASATPFHHHPAAIAAVTTGLEVAAAVDREQIRKLEGVDRVKLLIRLPAAPGSIVSVW